jgi:hypothetical protein
MKLITELNEDVKYTTEEVVDEATGAKKKNLYIEGVFLQSGVVNRNKRIYPTEILGAEVGRYVKEYVEKGRGYGELGHPTGPAINLDRVSHMIKGLRQDGNNFIGKAQIAETPFGNIAKGLMESGARLGVSSRGLGTLKPNSQGILEVQKDFRLAAGADIVADPSAPDAWVNGIMENQEWVLDPSGNWREVATIVESVKKMTKAEIEEQAVALFQAYMRKL